MGQSYYPVQVGNGRNDELDEGQVLQERGEVYERVGCLLFTGNTKTAAEVGDHLKCRPVRIMNRDNYKEIMALSGAALRQQWEGMLQLQI